MQIKITKETDKDGVWFLARKEEDNELLSVKRTLEELEEYLKVNEDFIKNGKLIEEVKTITL